MRPPLAPLVWALPLLGLLSACAPAGESPAGEPTPPTAAEPLPCDPGFGFPRPRAGCPDPNPLTAWLDPGPDGRLVLHPFRTLGNDAEGRAYARSHGLEFPFPNDYYDAPSGRPQELVPGPDTVCSGAIRVGYREPLEDHAVDCAELVDVATQRRLTVAVWRADGVTAQVSELYRP